MQVGTHYWFNKRTQQVEEFDKNYCVKDYYRPATYEEVVEWQRSFRKGRSGRKRTIINIPK